MPICNDSELFVSRAFMCKSQFVKSREDPSRISLCAAKYDDFSSPKKGWQMHVPSSRSLWIFLGASVLAVSAFVAFVDRDPDAYWEARFSVTGNFCHVYNETIYVWWDASNRNWMYLAQPAARFFCLAFLLVK